MRGRAFALLALACSGCSCPAPLRALTNPGVEKACSGPCPTFATRQAELDVEATSQWLRNGLCRVQQIDECPDGSHVVFLKDYCPDTSVFDKKGQMVGAVRGCEANAKPFGNVEHCDPVRTIDPCETALDALTLVDIEANLSAGREAKLDGVAQGKGTGPSLGLGKHTLEVAGEVAEFELSAGNGTGRVRWVFSAGAEDRTISFGDDKFGLEHQCEPSRACHAEVRWGSRQKAWLELVPRLGPKPPPAR